MPTISVLDWQSSSLCIWSLDKPSLRSAKSVWTDYRSIDQIECRCPEGSNSIIEKKKQPNEIPFQILNYVLFRLGPCKQSLSSITNQENSWYAKSKTVALANFTASHRGINLYHTILPSKAIIQEHNL